MLFSPNPLPRPPFMPRPSSRTVRTTHLRRAKRRTDAWPVVRDADELHDTLLSMGAISVADGRPWEQYFAELRSAGRATELFVQGMPFWVATERRSLTRAAWPQAEARPDVATPQGVRADWPREEAIAWIKRLPNPSIDAGDAEVEVREYYELEDFGDSPEIARFRKIGIGE